MNYRYELRVTRALPNGLQTDRFAGMDAHAVINAIRTSDASIATVWETTSDHSKNVYLMRHEERVYLALWLNDDDVCHLCSSDPESDSGVFVDVGWNRYAEWSVTSDFERAVHAAEIFLSTGEVDPELRWFHDEG